MSSSDVLIIGGGVIGASCARAMARRGHGVTVLESGPKLGNASLASAGMLAPLAESSQDDPMLGLAVGGRDLYVELAPILFEETEVDIGLWTDGILDVAFTEEEVADGKSHVAWQRQAGFPAEWLTVEDIQQLAPGISSEALGGAFAPEDGALDPLALLDALMKSAQHHGAKLLRGAEVERIVSDGGKVDGVVTASETHHAGTVLIAAGAWSGRLAGLPRPLSVEPMRGQLAAFEWPADEPAGIVYGAGGYVVARGSEGVAGSTVEYAGFDPSVTEAGLAKICASLRKTYPVFESASMVRSWAGLRPGTPDGNPIVGPDPELEGLWYATGHGRDGVLLAAVTGELMAQLHAGEEVEQDLSFIDPGRFWRS